MLGYGIQPRTPPSAELMTPKLRYQLLHEVVGELWLWFSVTASDQTHVDVAAAEVCAVTNLANLLAPAVIALCAHSPVHGGADSGVSSSREAMMGRIGAAEGRHGMPTGPSASLPDWVQRTLDLPYFTHHTPDGTLSAFGESFRSWLDGEQPATEEAFRAWLWHEHYIWNSARPRSAHGTVELRSPCQQPWADHMAPSALAVGMVCGHAEIGAWLGDLLGEEAWPAMRAWHAGVVRDGLAAEPPVPGLLEGLLERCERALHVRGAGEEVYLQPLFDRVRSQRGPADRARAEFATGGVEALVAALTVRA